MEFHKQVNKSTKGIPKNRAYIDVLLYRDSTLASQDGGRSGQSYKALYDRKLRL